MVSRRLLSGLLPLALLGGCAPATTPPAAAPRLPGVEALTGYAAEAPRHLGGTVVVGLAQFPTAFSPIFGGQAAAVPIEQALFNGLTGIDPSLHWYGDLAREAPTVENGRVKQAGAGMEVHFELRAGLTWSDGLPVTPDDVIWTWQAILAAPGLSAGAREGYDRITAIDREGETGLVMRYASLYPPYLALFGTILPRHRLVSVAPAQLSTDPYWAAPDVVSGPFTIGQVTAGRVTLRRNPAYAAGRPAPANLASVVFRAFPTKQAVLAAVKAGDVQVAGGLDQRDLETIAGLGEVRPHLVPALQYEQVSFNQADPNPLTGRPPPWAGDPLLLRALDLALDRSGILSGPLRSRAVAAAGPISPQVAWAFDPGLETPRQDLALARALLDQDGWALGAGGVRAKAGRRLSFSLSTTADQPLRAAEEEIVLAGWRALGAEVRAQNFPGGQLFATAADRGVLAGGGYEAALWAWITPADPDAEFNLLHSSRTPPAGSNYSRCRDAGVDAALEAGRASLDPLRRGAAYRSFQQAYRSARCELPLYQRLDVSVADRRLHNFAPNPTAAGDTWNLADWWLDR